MLVLVTVKLQQLVMQTQTVSPHHAEVNLTPECDGEPVPVHLLNRQIKSKLLISLNNAAFFCAFTLASSLIFCLSTLSRFSHVPCCARETHFAHLGASSESLFQAVYSFQLLLFCFASCGLSIVQKPPTPIQKLAYITHLSLCCLSL